MSEPARIADRESPSADRGKAIRIATIGVGHLGTHHARILSALDGVRFVAAVDTVAARAEGAASAAGARALTDYRDVLDEVDAVTIAAPTVLHHEIALPFLQRGIAVLVEKPMARSMAEADLMLDAARASGAVFGVGHTERYNPAVAAVLPLVTSPRFIEVHRLASFSHRSLDIDVVFDLMIHDLDVILTLVGSDVVSIESVGVPVLTSKYDIANARLRFASGCIANVTASRISREKTRKIRFFQQDAYLSIDYAAKEVEAWRLVRHNGIPTGIQGGPIPVEAGDSLERELSDFVDAARDRRPPLVDGEAGRRALDLATRVAERMTSV